MVWRRVICGSEPGSGVEGMKAIARCEADATGFAGPSAGCARDQRGHIQHARSRHAHLAAVRDFGSLSVPLAATGAGPDGAGRTSCPAAAIRRCHRLTMREAASSGRQASLPRCAAHCADAAYAPGNRPASTSNATDPGIGSAWRRQAPPSHQRMLEPGQQFGPTGSRGRSEQIVVVEQDLG